jgi:hypothetical protein
VLVGPDGCWGGTPGLLNGSSVVCPAVRVGSGRSHATPTGLVTFGVTSHQQTRVGPWRYPPRVLSWSGWAVKRRLVTVPRLVSESSPTREPWGLA